MDANIADNRWVREPGDFATRLGERELSGLFSRRIVIEEGTTGLLLVQGRFDRQLPPGEHILQSGMRGILRGRERKAVVIVTLGEVKLEAGLARLLTREPVPFSVQATLRLRFAPGRESVFLTNFMSGKDSLTVMDLRDLVFPDLKDAAQEWAGGHTIKELAENLSLKDELTMTLETHMRPVLDRYGLSFGRLELSNFTCAIWDRSVNRRVETSIQVTEEQAELEGRKRLFDIAVEKDIQDLAEETQKAATYEKRIQVWERLQRASNQEQVNRIRSEDDLADFIRRADRDRLLKEDDFEQFKVALREAGEDRERLRAHFLRVARIEQEYDFQRRELAQQANLSRQQLEGEMGLVRLRMESELQLELTRADLELERERRQAAHLRNEEDLNAAARWEREISEARKDAEIQGIQRETDRLDSELALALKEKQAAQDRLRQQELASMELDRKAREQELQIQNAQVELELRLRELRERHEQEMASMNAMNTLSLHALIAVSEDQKAPLLSELARTEALKSLSPEQILAMAAEKNPELGGALSEMATQSDNQQVKEMYERLLSEQKESSVGMRDAQREMTQTMQEMFNKALETQAQVAQVFAHGPMYNPQPVSPGAQPQVQPTPIQGQPQRVVICRRCMQESEVGTKHCPNCGNSLMTE